MTTEAIHLLPPPIDIALADHLPRCTANLMPLHIDYDGPAPVDSFLVQRSASSSSPSEGESFISAFRGRAIQSTPLPLPERFRAKVVTVSQVGSATPSGSASVDGRADAEATAKKDAEALARERDTKRRRIANQPPAKQQRFSIDSDDDDDDGNDDEEEQFDDDYASISMQPEQDAAATPAAVESTPESRQSQSTGPTIRIEAVAQIASDQLTIWGPDGPIDKGDDTFFRTVGEWYSVVTPLVSLTFRRYEDGLGFSCTDTDKALFDTAACMIRNRDR